MQPVGDQAGIGAILFADTKKTAFDLLKQVETAMYEAKKIKGGSLQFYEESMGVEVEEQLMLENDIHSAIRNDEFVMYYQSQLDVESNEIIGAEALIHWNHPQKGFVKPEWFELEITESGIMRNIDDAIRKIRELKSFGFTFSIDDFGTGHSSLSHLKELPVNVIKIDQSFVRDMNDDDEMIIEAVVAIGQKFNLEVLAEGVESSEILAYLQDIHCNTYQGFLAYTAVDLEVFEALLDAKK